MMGVLPKAFFAETGAPAAIRHDATSDFPFNEQICKPVLPRVSGTSNRAPIDSNACTAPGRPPAHAACKGVSLSWSNTSN